MPEQLRKLLERIQRLDDGHPSVALAREALFLLPAAGDEGGVTEQIGRFGHHRVPAIDFCVEMNSLEGLVNEFKCGMIDKEAVRRRILAALMFRVVDNESAVWAKQRLRKLDASLASIPVNSQRETREVIADYLAALLLDGKIECISINCEQMAAQIASLSQQWLLIDMAAKNGEEVLLGGWVNGEWVVMRDDWYVDREMADWREWSAYSEEPPTHYMPMPAVPTPPKQEG